MSKHEKLRIVGDGASCESTPAANAQLEPAGVMAAVGFTGNVAFVTLGCAKNTVDSEVMIGALQARGFRAVSEPENADLIVVNTCGFLQSAVEEGIDTILGLARLKTAGRCRKLFVAGCMVERYRAELEASMPEVDRFLSTDELLRISEDEATSAECFSEARRPYFLYDESMPRVLSSAGHTAYVKIAEGCDRPCAFCIIPKIRGNFRSRPAESILAEVRGLVERGVKEISFVAQDLTAYGADRSSKGSQPLTELLQSIDALSSQIDPFWLRLFYAYPIGVSRELVEVIRDSAVICNYLDLPLQHISSSVLKRMNRPLGGARTRGLIEDIRKWAPELTLRTTMLVGFPGETEADVKELEQYVAEGHFTHLGVFAYSQEQEAKSYSFEDQIAEEEKQERCARVLAAQRAVVNQRLESLIGTRTAVLIEGEHEETALLTSARASWQGPEVDGAVIINEVDEALLDHDGEYRPAQYYGRFGTVEITEVVEFDLIGQLVSVA